MSASTRPDAELAARWLAYVLAAGAAFIVLALLVLPLPAGTDRESAAVVGACTAALAAIVFALRHSLPQPAIGLLVLPVSTVLVSMGIEAWGSAPTDLGMFYVWIVLYAAYFLSFPQALAQIAVVGVCYGVVLVRIDAGEPAITRWAVTVGTLAIAGSVIARLMRRLRTEVAGHERVARERERLLELLQTAALTDDLTGLPNRRARDGALDRELARSGRQQDALCVAVLDLDNFKRYNDTHGHAGGDQLLRAATAAWSTQLRASDLLARHGGEEFTLLLPECDERDALALVERLRVQTPAGQTVSAGLAQWDGREDADALLERADAALYAAKAAGRDRAVLAPAAAAVA